MILIFVVFKIIILPIIGMVAGVKLYMYFNDHNPPHFHANYQGDKSTYDFNGDKLTGKLPPKKEKKVSKWASNNAEVLKRNGMSTINEYQIILADIVNLLKVYDDFSIVVRFRNEKIDEIRLIDFRTALPEIKGREIKPDDIAYPIINDLTVFKTVKLYDDHNICWPSIGFETSDINGNPMFAAYDLDPGMLYQHSQLLLNLNKL